MIGSRMTSAARLRAVAIAGGMMAPGIVVRTRTGDYRRSQLYQ